MLAIVADRYHLVAPLREGGMGAVYDAIHSGTGRRVAVKLLRADLVASEKSRLRFIREARLAGGLASPHVAEVLDAGTDDTSGLPYIAMEFLEGDDLRVHLSRRGRLPVGLALVIAAHVSAGLAAAHEAGVIHRDVKPANIVLCRDAHRNLLAKLIDFGVAKAPADEDQVVTETGALVGSLPYMSPEQLRGGTIDPRADLWSLGIVMYETIAGVRPTGPADAISEIVLRACVQGFPRLEETVPGVPEAVADLVHRALSVEKEDRFASAREMHDAIAALLGDTTDVPAAMLEQGGDEISVVARAASPARKADPIATEITTATTIATRPPPPKTALSTKLALLAGGLAAAVVAFVGVRAAKSDGDPSRPASEPALASPAASFDPAPPLDTGTVPAPPAPAATASSGTPSSASAPSATSHAGTRAGSFTPSRAPKQPQRAKPSSEAPSKDPLGHM